MLRVLLLFLLAIFFLPLQAQNEDYDQAYRKIYLEVAPRDFNHALHLADSLYAVSESPLQLTKSLMLSASLLERKGERSKAIEFALQAQREIEKSKNYSWETRILGFLASQYRNTGLIKESQYYMAKAEKAAARIENPEQSYVVLGMLNQEQAYLQSSLKNYELALEKLHKAADFFLKTNVDRQFLLGKNAQLLGDTYLNLEQPEEAREAYHMALQHLKSQPGSVSEALAYMGLTEIALQVDSLSTAKKQLILAEQIVRRTEHLPLTRAFLRLQAHLYDLEEDRIKRDIAQAEFDSINHILNQKQTNFIDTSYSSLRADSDLKTLKVKRQVKIGIILLVLFVLGGGYLLYDKQKRTKELKRFKALVQEWERREQAESSTTEELKEELKEEADHNIRKDLNIAQETIDQIIQKLEEFEKEQLFLDSGVSLTTIAVFCETNNRYLSNIISHFRKDNFNNYINRLRVEYVVDKLKNEPIYRQYKISVLAEEAGFSSASKFSNVFKKITEISPSQFIKFLEEEIAEEA